MLKDGKLSFENVINLMNVEMKSKNNKIEQYDIESSVVNSSTIGAEKLGFNVKVLKPGQFSYPYHYHSENEEVFIILKGELTLRQNDKRKILQEGDFVFLKNSKEGAHQLYNHTNEPVRYVGIASKSNSDICYYPDSNKINFGMGEIYKLESKVDYYDGEKNVPKFWSK